MATKRSFHQRSYRDCGVVPRDSNQGTAFRGLLYYKVIAMWHAYEAHILPSTFLRVTATRAWRESHKHGLNARDFDSIFWNFQKLFSWSFSTAEHPQRAFCFQSTCIYGGTVSNNSCQQHRWTFCSQSTTVILCKIAVYNSPISRSCRSWLLPLPDPDFYSLTYKSPTKYLAFLYDTLQLVEHYKEIQLYAVHEFQTEARLLWAYTVINPDAFSGIEKHKKRWVTRPC